MTDTPPVKMREPTFRRHVADLAKLVLAERLDYFHFLTEVGGEPDAYETGDDEVDELIDILEHHPAFGLDRLDALLQELSLSASRATPLTLTISVKLLDEAVDCWRPVQAEPVDRHVYRIVSTNPHPEDEHWQFPSGSRVKCKLQQLEGSLSIVAVASAEPAN